MSEEQVSIDQPRALFAAVSLSAIAVLVFNALPVIVGTASDSLGLGDDTVGLMASLELAGIGITATSGMLWIRRIPWRPASIMALLVIAVGNLLSLQVGSAEQLLALRFVVGLAGEGLVFTIAMAAIGDSRQADRAFAFAIIGQIGLGAVALWAFPQIAAGGGFAAVMSTMAALALLGIALVAWLPRGGAKVAKAEGEQDATPRDIPVAIPLTGLAAMFIWFIGLSGIWAFIERIGVAVGISQASVGTLLAAGLAGGLVSSGLAAWLGDRYGRLWPPLVAVGLHILMCLVIAGGISAITYAAVVLAFTFVWNLGLPYLLGLIANSDSSGKLVVLMISAQAFGNTLGQLLAGQVAAGWGDNAIGLSSAVMCLAALAVLGLFTRRIRQLPRGA
jgi:predicted MFS family arabinose efflux permease